MSKGGQPRQPSAHMRACRALSVSRTVPGTSKKSHLLSVEPHLVGRPPVPERRLILLRDRRRWRLVVVNNTSKLVQLPFIVRV